VSLTEGKVLTQAEFDELLALDMGEFFNDPLGWVKYAFHWGEGDLSNWDGPDEWQTAWLTCLGERLEAGDLLGDAIHTALSSADASSVRMATTSGHGVGKAQPHSLMLHTPDGLRRWGDLKVGDFVFGTNGLPTRILAVHPQGELPVYRVSFDDGSSTRACADHKWTVRGRNERRTDADWVTRSTQEIMEAGVRRPNGRATAKQWELPQHEKVEFPARDDLAIAPYTLGVWLGDGGRMSARITSADTEVIEHLREAGETIRPSSDPMAWGVAGLATKLQAVGVLDKYSYQKSVPVAYMEAPSEIRAEVLRGLMDTDGECNSHGSAVFSSTSLALAEDVIWLARSLGGKARMQPAVKKPQYRGPNGELLEGRPCWRATITMPNGFRLFYIERKQARLRNVESRYLARWMDRIEPDGAEKCSCITVEADDSCYLTNDFIVTHNSAVVAWIICWAMSTRPNLVGVVTANTVAQLEGKTWRELALWHKRMVNHHWFEWTATRFKHRDSPETWRVDAVPWREENPEAFAGLHGEHVLVMFDEASAVADIIWEVAEGAMTTPGAIWCVFGNPTRNEGRFRNCFEGGKFAHRWNQFKVDSRTAKAANKRQIEDWRIDYGEDSDFFRVRVRGEFPRTAGNQFFDMEKVAEAAAREPEYDDGAALVMGCDVARFGDAETVIRFRRGRDAKTIPAFRYRGLDTMQSAQAIANLIDEWKPDACFVDETGVGAGVVDRLKQLGYRVIGVMASGKVKDSTRFNNRRIESYDAVRQWVDEGGCLPNEPEILDQFAQQTFSYDLLGRYQQLLDKNTARKQGMASPDDLDALALTFAEPVARKDIRRNGLGAHVRVADSEYNIFSQGSR
jgi:hypothetical protein